MRTPTSTVTRKEVELIGDLADRAHIFLMEAQRPTPATASRVRDRIVGLLGGMETLRDELRKLYVAMSGNNPWEGLT